MPKVLVFLILALPLVGAYAMYASGIVVIYQASRVLNLAHGAMATIPAYLVYTMVERWGVPLAVALPLGIASGAGLGIVIERLFVRRLRDAGSTAQTVGTVAAFGLTIALAAKIWGTSGLAAPGVFPDGHVNVGNSILRYGQLGILGVALVATFVLTMLFRKTWLGLAMRGAAVNRRAAALMGVNPDMTSTVAWALGGGLAALAGILLAAVTVLHPFSLSVSVLPAFVAALIGGLESLGAALVGSAIVGLVVGFVPLLADLPGFSVVFGQVGGPELALAVTAMVVMAARGQRLIGTDVRQVGGAPARRRPAEPWLPRISPRILLALLIGWVWLPGIPFTILGTANVALLYTIAAASLVLLTGWIGQISLAQAAFVGIGAFGSVQVAERFGVPFPFTIVVAGALAAAVAVALGVVALRVRGLYLAVATLIFAWMADQYLFSAPWLVGAGGSATAEVDPIGYEGGFPYFDFSDRRTFYVVALAGVALVLLALANIRRSKTGRAFFAIRGSEMAAASLGIDVTRYKLLAFGLSGFIAGMAGNLIVVDQETVVPAQFVFTVSLFFLSIAVVGGLQSLGGAVAASVIFAALNEVFFRVEALQGWLDVVSASLLVAVLIFYPGGLARAPEVLEPLGRRVASVVRRTARALVPARTQARGEPEASPLEASLARARAAVLAGARRVAHEVRSIGREIGAASDSVLASAEARAPAGWKPRVSRLRAQVRSLRGEARGMSEAARTVKAQLERFGAEVDIPGAGDAGSYDSLATLHGPAATNGSRALREAVLTGDARLPGAVLAAERITVRFGGVVAVNDARVAIREGEIVGLIGPNGAGKTTMFNAIAGFVVPNTGAVRLRNEDVTSLQVHERAARGIGRTFQVIQLAPELTVLENLLVATHTRNPSTFLSDLVVTNRSAIGERRAMERVRRVAELVGITDVLEEPVAGLPFGTLRMVEVARALATGSPLIMLDEPASGLDDAETQRFAELLRFLRDTLGVSLLLIEHDVRLVMSLCDYVYVLDRGDPIAEGTPAEVQRDPAVIAAYLGGGSTEQEAAASVPVG